MSSDPRKHDAKKENTNRHVYIDPSFKVDLAQDLKNDIRTYASDNAADNQRQLSWARISAAAAIVAAFFVGWQGYETRKAVEVARSANTLTEESIRARLVMTDFDFLRPVTAGQRTAIKVHIKNIGRSQAVYGIATDSYRWRGLPDGDIPLTVTDISIPLQVDVPIEQAIFEQEPITQEIIDGIPTLTDLRQSPNNLKPGIALNPTPLKATIYFIGKLVYDSIGRRQEDTFCIYLIRSNESSAKEFGIPPVPGDPNFIFMKCPKWNTSREAKTQ